MRPEGRIYFANADRVCETVLELAARADGLRLVVLDASAVPDLEYTGLEMLERLRRELAARGIELALAALNARPRAMVEARELRVPLFTTVDEAVKLHSAHS